MFRTFREAFIPVWGVVHLLFLFIRPGIVGNFPVWASSASLFILFVAIIANYFIFDLDIVWYLLTVRSLFGMVCSWTGITVWNVSYDPAIAAISMAFLDLIAALAFYSKAIPGVEE